MIRQADGVYRLDHAVTATQKDILQAFNLTAEFEEVKDVYEKFLEEQKEDKKRLFEACKKSKRTLDEVIDFMKGNLIYKR